MPADKLSIETRFQNRLAQPDERALLAIRKETWTGHNIPLTQGESTLGLHIPLIADDARTLAIKSVIRRFLGNRDQLRILDLGSLEGGLAIEMAREGWEVLGVEGRESNYRKAELIRTYFGLPNLRFELRDVKTLDASRDGAFDVILGCGILYHIANPFLLLELLRPMVAPDGLLFLDTHVAPDANASRFDTHASHLTAASVLEHAGRSYEGQWSEEPREGSVLEQQWAAVSDERAFWPTRRALIRGVYHAGFHAIHELFGMFEIDREFGLRDQFSRLYLVCLPDW